MALCFTPQGSHSPRGSLVARATTPRRRITVPLCAQLCASPDNRAECTERQSITLHFALHWRCSSGAPWRPGATTPKHHFATLQSPVRQTKNRQNKQRPSTSQGFQVSRRYHATLKRHFAMLRSPVCQTKAEQTKQTAPKHSPQGSQVSRRHHATLKHQFATPRSTARRTKEEQTEHAQQPSSNPEAPECPRATTLR